MPGVIPKSDIILERHRQPSKINLTLPPKQRHKSDLITNKISHWRVSIFQSPGNGGASF